MQQVQEIISLYEGLLQAYAQLESEIARRQPGAVRECMNSIGDLMLQIEKSPVESVSATDFSDPGDAGGVIPELHSLVRQAAEKNHALLQKGRAVMAVLADEMHSVGENRQMIAGYGGMPQSTGGRINIRSA
jgi:hypothetical protein